MSDFWLDDDPLPPGHVNVRVSKADARAFLHKFHARALQNIAKYKTSTRALTEGEKQVLEWHIETAQDLERELEKLGKV
jgi:hypothetical protein